MNNHRDTRLNPASIAATLNEAFDWPTWNGASVSSADVPEQAAAGSALDDVNVRLGGQAPMFTYPEIADEGLVRLGGQSPLF